MHKEGGNMIRINTQPEVGLTPRKTVVDPKFLKAFLENIRTYFK
jgi:hypothetical protein